MEKNIRPTKKQRLLLEFIADFIAEHGYSPSYREIMVGCNYTSVATVALHINNLIKRGHLRKRDNSARSLEIVEGEASKSLLNTKIKASQEKWLVDLIDERFSQAEAEAKITQYEMDSLYVLVGALRVLELEGAYTSFLPRIGSLREKL